MELHDHSLSQSTLKMALQVYYIVTLCNNAFCNFLTHTVAPGDYGAMTNQIIAFTAGQMRATHRIIINQDDECEDDPNENFFSNIALDSGTLPISVIRPRAEVIIDNTNESECSKCHTHTIVIYLLFMHCTCAYHRA